jgi:uncharacterized protein (DUF3084 family)
MSETAQEWEQRDEQEGEPSFLPLAEALQEENSRLLRLAETIRDHGGALGHREAQVAQRERQVAEAEEALAHRTRELDQREHELRQLADRADEVNTRLAEVSAREAALAALGAELAGRYAGNAAD